MPSSSSARLSAPLLSPVAAARLRIGMAIAGVCFLIAAVILWGYRSDPWPNVEVAYTPGTMVPVPTIRGLLSAVFLNPLCRPLFLGVAAFALLKTAAEGEIRARQRARQAAGK